MAIDLKKSFGLVLEKPIATGTTITEEGLLLVRSVEAGVEKVLPGSAAGSLVVVGFSMSNMEQPATVPNIENLTIATGSPYTAQLSHTNLVGTTPTVEMRVFDTVTGADISTQVASTGAIVDTNKWFVDSVTGLLTVHSSRASHLVTVYYRYNLTVTQSQQLFFQPNVNFSINVLGLIGVYCGVGQIYTLQYDNSVDYSVASPALKTGALGKVTIGGAGTDITPLMRVIKSPTAADVSLGLEFNIG